ncbi:hypothetical protein CBR_g23403 [Chara braunii]|uniref:CDC45-like protein n=1 Tax=Chara braunii TaxID=69332 RepID=A0A388L452_CHABU|nr:hypothetical protein CBR_g23403 [Chara braunii]|eukprot:GBG77077.1 hypothetical protein CBR_g23403 [Chara braunii]
MINCGATEDLRCLLNVGRRALIFVIDSHRPIHLQNLNQYNKQVVVVYTDEDEAELNTSYSFPVSHLANNPESDSELDDSDLESDEDEDEDEEDEDDDEFGGLRVRGARTRRGQDTVDRQEKRRRQKQRVEYYARGSYYGRPSGCIMYDIAHQLRRNTNELLWLSCVSLTDHFIHERLTHERYQAVTMELEQQINSLGNLEVVTTATLEDGTKVHVPEVDRITYEEEPRLMLLRFWSLFEAMLHSTYVATKLKTWSEPGRKRMKLLLVGMGVPLVESYQLYLHMNRKIKRRLKEEFERRSPEYGLTELFYRSFQKFCGFKSRMWTSANEASLCQMR